MDAWKPWTIDEVREIVDAQIPHCAPEQQAVFEQYRVAPFRAPICRYGLQESVVIVARRDNEVMYWEDVEEGFNFSPIDDAGRVLEHWCNQDDLRHALWHWVDARGVNYLRRGPARPLAP